MADRIDPYRNFRFKVEIEGITQAGFSEATVPDTSSDVVEYRDGNDPTTVKKLSGLTKYGNLTLKSGVTDSMKLYEWRKSVIESGAISARKTVSIIVLDEAGAESSTRWVLKNAWPSKYDAPDFNAKGNDVAIELLEIVHEGMTRGE